MIMTEDVLLKTHYLCEQYQNQRVSGLVYVSETGYSKVSKLLGFDYKKLTPKQRKQFRRDCINSSTGQITAIKDYQYYLSLWKDNQ